MIRTTTQIRSTTMTTNALATATHEPTGGEGTFGWWEQASDRRRNRRVSIRSAAC
jgi:hypothetical protein